MTTTPSPKPRPRPATPVEVRCRVGQVQEWIIYEHIRVEEALQRITDEFGVGRRQAIRYWVRAYVPYLSPEDQRARAEGHRPRDWTGFTMWPSIEGTDM